MYCLTVEKICTRPPGWQLSAVPRLTPDAKTMLANSTLAPPWPLMPPPLPQRSLVAKKGRRKRSDWKGSVVPEVLEAASGKFGVADGVLYVSVPEVMLDGAGVLAVVGEPVTNGMTEHVGMDGEGEPRGLADARQELAEAGCCHRCAPLGSEDERGGRPLLAPETAERSEFDAA